MKFNKETYKALLLTMLMFIAARMCAMDKACDKQPADAKARRNVSWHDFDTRRSAFLTAEYSLGRDILFAERTDDKFDIFGRGLNRPKEPELFIRIRNSMVLPYFGIGLNEISIDGLKKAFRNPYVGLTFSIPLPERKR
jgi:hypothetical protein